MANESLVFTIIATIVIIVFLFIFFRIWEIIKPYIILARKIIRVIDIIKNFTTDIALTLLNLIRDVITGIFRIFNFDDTIVLALNNTVAKINELLDDETISNLLSEGKRIVVTAIGQTAENAVRFANQLTDKLAPVSLVLFDPEISPNVKINDNVHVINIKSKDLNVSARGADDILDLNISKSQNGRAEYNIIKPRTHSVGDYMEAVKQGFL